METVKRSNNVYLETTEVPADRSAAEVTAELVKAGARSITTMHGDDGGITGVSWTFREGAIDLHFALPAKVDGVFRILKARLNGKYMDRDKLESKAERIAWRQLLMWVKAQNAMIQTGMVQPHQVFMPYALNRDGRTMFEVWTSQLALPAPQKEEGAHS